VLLFPLQVDEGLSGQVHDAYILKEITGSDHVPLGIVIKKSDA
jgi:exonuclease III